MTSHTMVYPGSEWIVRWRKLRRESYRSTIHYSELWEKMVVFSKDNGIEINVPFQGT